MTLIAIVFRRFPLLCCTSLSDSLPPVTIPIAVAIAILSSLLLLLSLFSVHQFLTVTVNAQLVVTTLTLSPFHGRVSHTLPAVTLLVPLSFTLLSTITICRPQLTIRSSVILLSRLMESSQFHSRPTQLTFLAAVYSLECSFTSTFNLSCWSASSTLTQNLRPEFVHNAFVLGFGEAHTSSIPMQHGQLCLLLPLTYASFSSMSCCFIHLRLCLPHPIVQSFHSHVYWVFLCSCYHRQFCVLPSDSHVLTRDSRPESVPNACEFHLCLSIMFFYEDFRYCFLPSIAGFLTH